MIDEKYLRQLGFTDFEHLDKNKRDSFRRLAAVRFVEDQCFTIVLIYRTNLWELERFSFDGDRSILQKYFPSNPTLNEIIEKIF